jgi:hypothetical protein
MTTCSLGRNKVFCVLLPSFLFLYQLWSFTNFDALPTLTLYQLWRFFCIFYLIVNTVWRFSINSPFFVPLSHFFLSVNKKLLKSPKQVLLTESHRTSFIFCVTNTPLCCWKLPNKHLFIVESRRSTSIITWFLLLKHRNILWRLFTDCLQPIKPFYETRTFFGNPFGFQTPTFQVALTLLFLSIDIAKGWTLTTKVLVLTIKHNHNHFLHHSVTYFNQK